MMRELACPFSATKVACGDFERKIESSSSEASDTRDDLKREVGWVFFTPSTSSEASDARDDLEREVGWLFFTPSTSCEASDARDDLEREVGWLFFKDD